MLVTYITMKIRVRQTLKNKSLDVVAIPIWENMYVHWLSQIIFHLFN